MRASVVLAILPAVAVLGCSPRDEMVFVKPDDAKVNAAIAEARATLPLFWTKYDHRSSDTSEYLVKLALPTPDGGVEHIWATLVSHSDVAVRARLAQAPDDLGALREGSEVTVAPTSVSDWTYEKGGKKYGGYTMRALLDRTDPAERKAQAAMLAPTPLEAEVH